MPCPVTAGSAEVLVPIFLIGPLPVSKGCKKASLESSLLQAEQPQLSHSVAKEEREMCVKGALLGPLGSNLAT